MTGALLAVAALLAGCADRNPALPTLEPLPVVTGGADTIANARVNGRVGTPDAVLPAQVSEAPAQTAELRVPVASLPAAMSRWTSPIPTSARSRRKSSATSCV